MAKKLELGANASPLVQGLNRAIKAAERFVQAQEKIVKETGKHNQITDDMLIRLQSAADAFTNITRTIALTQDGFELLEVSTIKNVKAIDAYNEGLKVIAENAARAKEALAAVNDIQVRPPKDATRKETIDYKQAIGQLKDFITKNQVTAKRVREIWEGVSNGVVASYKGMDGKVQALLLKIKAREEALGSERARQHQISIQKQEQLEQKQYSRYVKFLIKRKLEEIKQKEESLKKQEAAEYKQHQKVTRYLLGKIKERARLEENERKRIASEKEGDKVVGGISAGVSFEAASQRETAAFQTALGNLRAYVEKTGVSGSRVLEIWRNVEQGRFQAYSGTDLKIQTMAIKLNKLHQDLGKKTIDDQNQKLKELSLTWRSAFRLAFVQLAHKSIAALIRLMSEGIQTTITLQKKVAEIQTISQAQQLPFREWASGLRELSDSFGIPILDQAEAAYQTLSNQVAKGAEALEFLVEVNKFAVASVSETSTSTNLLTAAINSFRLNVQDTDKIAASFFKTIELGRVRAEDLSETYGVVSVPAAQLGISMNELNAAIATATINGVKYSRASTLIRNVLLKLIRPTKEMNNFLRSMGFSTGEAAIRALGLGRVLSELEKRTRGSADELGEMFGRIRAISGAMLFAGEGLVQYKSNLKELENAQTSYGNATRLVMENTGKKLEIEMNKIKNFFIEDLAFPLLEAVSKVTNGFKSITDVVKDFTRVLISTAVTAVVLYTTRLAAMVQEIRRSEKYLALMNSKLGLIIAGTAALISVTQLLIKVYEDVKRAAEARDKSLEAAARSAELRAEKAFKQQNSLLRESVLLRKRLVESEAKFATERYSKMLKDIMETYDEITNTTNDSFNNLQASIRSVSESIKKLPGTFGEEVFEFDVKFADPKDKINLITQRLADLNRAMSGVSTKQQYDELASKSLNLLKQRIDIANSFNEDEIKEGEKRKKQYQGILKIEERINELLKARRDFRKLTNVKSEINSINSKLTTAYKQLAEKMKNVNVSEFGQYKKTGEVKLALLDDYWTNYRTQLKELETLEEETLRRLAKIRKDEAFNNFSLEKRLIDLKTTYERSRKFDLGKTLEMTDIEAIDAALGEQTKLLQKMFDISGTFDTEESKKFQKDLIAESIKNDTAYNKRSKELGIESKKEELQEQYDLILANIRQTELAVDKSKARQVMKLARELSKDTDSLSYLADITGAKDIGELSNFNRFHDFRVTLEHFAKAGDDSEEAIKRLQKAIDEFTQGRVGVVTTKDNFLTGWVEKAVDARGQLLDLTRGLKNYSEEVRVTKERMDTLATAQERLVDIKQQLTGGKVEPEKTLSHKDLLGALETARKITEELKSLTGVNAGGGGRGFAAGGLVGSGTDSIAARLMPGEFVMNKAATNRFYSQLVSMNNAGSKSDVTNPVTTFTGDFNISVESSGRSEIDVIEIGRQLKKEIARGRVQLT